jgi:hypothetical protein
MLEKLGFQQLVEETLTVKRVTRAINMYQFVLSMVLSVYVRFSRLHHLRFLKREPMLTGILKVLRLPPQCTFWRFLASLHLGIARQLLEVQRRMRERVWEAAHVQLAAVTLDTDTTVHALFGHQMGGRKSYNLLWEKLTEEARRIDREVLRALLRNRQNEAGFPQRPRQHFEAAVDSRECVQLELNIPEDLGRRNAPGAEKSATKAHFRVSMPVSRG